MQVQAQTADVATFCLGERAHPSLCVMIPCRRKCPAGAGKMKCIFCDCESCLCRFLGILGCEYAFVSDNTDLIAVFRNCVVQYAKNSTCASGMKVSWAEAQRELLVHAYTWLLYHFDQGEAHRIHRNLIVHSLFWLAFAKSFDDRNRPGHIPFNPVYWQNNLKNGQTAMNAIGDPMDKADKLFSTLGSLFDDIRLQRLAVGEPCREDYRKQEDEIVQHLAKLARDKKHDAFPLPASVPNPILVLAPSHRWWTEMPGTPRGVLAKRRGQAPPEAPESDEESGMDTTAPESTDTEMHRAAEQSLLITHDHQALKVQNVARIQCQAEEEARSNVQAQFYEMADQDTRHVHLRRESEEREIEPRCRLSPQHRPRQEERGRSILKKRTANTDKAAPRQPHSNQGVPHGIGSPLATFPDNRTPMGTGDRSNQQQAFQTTLKQCYSDYASGRSHSRKREHTQSRRTAAPTPMQSPAQKNFKVKSTVTLVEPASQPRCRSCSRHRGWASEMPTWCPHRRAPYHLIGIWEVMGQEGQDSEKALLLYIMDRFMWEYYSPELNDFGNAFGSKTVFITRSCMAAALYFEVAWARGEKWIFPLIPDLMSRTPLRHGGKFPEKPTSSKGRHADDLKLQCREWWMYFLVLLQCWKDETCAFEYGGALRPDSKVLLFIYFRLKNLLKKAGVIDFHLYQVRNKTNWSIAM